MAGDVNKHLERAKRFLEKNRVEDAIQAYLAVLDISLPGFEREGKRFVTIAVGCTGGKHRSVAMAEQLAARLTGRDVSVSHRDLGRE